MIGVGRSVVQADGGKLAGFPTSPCAQACASGRCLLTGESTTGGRQVCCAWDTFLTMTASDGTDDVS
jgi:hypothetical protein